MDFLTHRERPVENRTMSLETLIPYIVQHNAMIIQALVSAILLLVVVLAYRNFSSARQVDPSVSPAVAGDMGQLEATLKKLLEKANQVPTAASASPGDNPALLTEIEKLKKSLEERQNAFEKLKVEAEAAKAAGGAPATAPGISAEERTQLETQIKELQAKLSEYEIISEDIADLSFYKEENVKLQKELEGIKKGGAPSTTAAPTTAAAESARPAPVMAGSAKATVAAAAVEVAAPEPVAKTPAPPIVEVAPPVAAEPELPPPPPPTPAKSTNPHAAVDDDLMAEFAKAVESQKPANESKTVSGAAPAAAPPIMVTGDPTADENPLGSGVDLDKVAAEVTQLDSSADVGNSLDGELNPDKLLEEAAGMDSIKPEDAKLMNEFEDFVKKGGVG